MEFLLECIGFPPDANEHKLIARVRADGEPVPYRGDSGNHLRLALGGGLELRLDREPQEEFWTLLPYYNVPNRLRVAVESLQRVPDSPFDVLMNGWVDPPPPGMLDSPYGEAPGAYFISTWLSDARRLPRRLMAGHVLAVSIAGFALDVGYIGPNENVAHPAILERPRGCFMRALGGKDSPGGCVELSARIKSVRHILNALTGRPVDLIEVDAPGRPLMLFVSPWQIGEDNLPAPKPGWRIEGSFMLTGRIAGGLQGPQRSARRSFG